MDMCMWLALARRDADAGFPFPENHPHLRVWHPFDGKAADQPLATVWCTHLPTPLPPLANRTWVQIKTLKGQTRSIRAFSLLVTMKSLRQHA